jgi:hypothetical protein
MEEPVSWPIHGPNITLKSVEVMSLAGHIASIGAVQRYVRFFGVPRLDFLPGPGPHIVRAHR